jgi:hypothetical protein
MCTVFSPKSRTPLITGQGGQVLIEFILLVGILCVLGILTVRFINGPLGELWKAVVEFIAEDTVSFR